MTDLDVFKRYIGYKVKADQDTFTGNGSTLSVNLRYENIFGVEVYFNDELQPISSYTVDSEPGVITFTDAPPDQMVVTINYKFAPFTDAEATELIATYGLERAVVEALRELLANQSRMMNYKHADTEVDHSQVFKQIKTLLEYYEKQTFKDESGEVSGLTLSRRVDPRGDKTCREQDISRLYGQYY